MTQSVPIGMSVTLDQNVTYALPAKPVYVNSSQAVQTSLDGTTWNAYTAGSVSSGKFIRSTLVGTVVSLSEAGKAAGSGTVSGSGSFQDFIAVGANPAQSGQIRLPDAGAIKNRNINGASDMSVLTAYTSVIVLGEGQPVSMYGPLSLGLTPAQSGAIRLGNNAKIMARDAANTTEYNVISMNTGNVIVLGQGGEIDLSSASLLIVERPSPAAPPVNSGRIWLQDNGSGKTQLMVQFNTGGPIQIAIQP